MFVFTRTFILIFAIMSFSVAFDVGSSQARDAAAAAASANGDPIPTPALCETRQIMVGTLQRSYILCVPQNLNGPAPVILAFHGAGSTALLYRAKTGLDTEAAQSGIITAYLNGCSAIGCNGGTWNIEIPWVFYSSRYNIDDKGFVRAVIDEINAEYNIDETRIFATGSSDGGEFSYVLACDMSDLFAAVAPLAATMADNSCKPQTGVSIFHAHGGKDTMIPFAGGGPFWAPPVMNGLEAWASMNGCTPKTEQVYADQMTECRRFIGCASGLDVEWCFVPEADHSGWPLDAATFLRQHMVETLLQHPKTAVPVSFPTAANASARSAPRSAVTGRAFPAERIFEVIVTPSRTTSLAQTPKRLRSRR